MDNSDKFNKDVIHFDAYKSAIDFGDPGAFMNFPLAGAASDDELVFPSTWGQSPDSVNSPSHYTRGKQEAIEIIEEAIQDAPDPKSGMLQAQVLKYLLRLWLKDNPEEDARKAQWYLNRLVDSLN
jgi:hypothetical protein